MDDNDDSNGIVPQERPQRRVPVSQDNEDLVVKGKCYASSDLLLHISYIIQPVQVLSFVFRNTIRPVYHQV